MDIPNAARNAQAKSLYFPGLSTTLCRRDLQGTPRQSFGRTALVKTTLINIRVGKLKSISDQLDPRRLVFRQHDFDDVEAKKNVGIVEQPKPGESAHRNSLTLVAT